MNQNKFNINTCDICWNYKNNISSHTNADNITLNVCGSCAPSGVNYNVESWREEHDKIMRELNKKQDNACQICDNNEEYVSRQTNKDGITLRVCENCAPYGPMYTPDAWFNDEDSECQICGNNEEYVSSQTNEDGITLEVCEHCAPYGSMYTPDAWSN